MRWEDREGGSQRSGDRKAGAIFTAKGAMDAKEIQGLPLIRKTEP